MFVDFDQGIEVHATSVAHAFQEALTQFCPAPFVSVGLPTHRAFVIGSQSRTDDTRHRERPAPALVA